MIAVSYGDVGTCDHFITKDRLSKGYDGKTHGITFRDRVSGWAESTGVIDKSVDLATDAPCHWVGTCTTYRHMCSDGSPELIKAMKNLGVPLDNSHPGRPTNNARAERSNRHVLAGARDLLLRAGLPTPFWTYALVYFCLCCNIRECGGKPSAWFKRFG